MMTVAELIEKLSTFPEHALVVIQQYESSGYSNIEEIELIYGDTVSLADF